MNFNRTIQELEKNASKWWPDFLLSKDAKVNIIPKLINTQRDFLNILSLSKNSPEQIISLLQASEFSVNLFVKHLCVLADYGGEPLQRLNNSFSKIFPDKIMYFTWNGTNYEYTFKALPVTGLNNTKLKLDGNGLSNDEPFSSLYEDIIMILLHGSASTKSSEASLEKCMIGVLLGKDEELESFIDQRYIEVSRITGGATANSLGQLAQKHIVNFLTEKLDDNFSVVSNGHIALKGYAKKGGMPFDVVVKKTGFSKELGIEISFQVTTNSTIERKAGQAADRQQLMHSNGHKIAYIIDGAGNFQRTSAVSTICSNSDCTIAFTDSELDVLIEWISNEFN